jgi:hypothetical protein
MTKPVFVETSKGLINLALIEHITERGDHVSFWFDAKENNVEVPIQEWAGIRAKMAEADLLLL